MQPRPWTSLGENNECLAQVWGFRTCTTVVSVVSAESPFWSLGSPFCRSGVLPDVRVPTTGVSLSYDKCSPPMGFATAHDTTISRLLPDGFRNNR